MYKEVKSDIPEFFGDRDRLLQVMINMISKAVKFTQKVRRLSSNSTRKPYYRQRYSTGIGIATSNLEKNFEKFKPIGDTFTDLLKGLENVFCIVKEEISKIIKVKICKS